MRTAAKKKGIFQYRRAERRVSAISAVIMQLQNGAGREKIPARFNLCAVQRESEKRAEACADRFEGIPERYGIIEEIAYILCVFTAPVSVPCKLREGGKVTLFGFGYGRARQYKQTDCHSRKEGGAYTDVYSDCKLLFTLGIGTAFGLCLIFLVLFFGLYSDLLCAF